MGSQSMWIAKKMLNSTHTKNKSRKKWWQRWNSVRHINENAVYGKAMET